MSDSGPKKCPAHKSIAKETFDLSRGARTWSNGGEWGQRNLFQPIGHIQLVQFVPVGVGHPFSIRSDRYRIVVRSQSDLIFGPDYLPRLDFSGFQVQPSDSNLVLLILLQK